jgi:hypothetical protein
LKLLVVEFFETFSEDEEWKNDQAWTVLQASHATIVTGQLGQYTFYTHPQLSGFIPENGLPNIQ